MGPGAWKIALYKIDGPPPHTHTHTPTKRGVRKATRDAYAAQHLPLDRCGTRVGAGCRHLTRHRQRPALSQRPPKRTAGVKGGAAGASPEHLSLKSFWGAGRHGWTIPLSRPPHSRWCCVPAGPPSWSKDYAAPCMLHPGHACSGGAGESLVQRREGMEHHHHRCNIHFLPDRSQLVWSLHLRPADLVSHWCLTACCRYTARLIFPPHDD